MKKLSTKLMTLVLALPIIMSSITPASAQNQLSVTTKLPQFPVQVNGILIDTKHAKYPLLLYKDITYFPMTWDYTRALGLNVGWDPDSGLEINQDAPANDWSQDSSGLNEFQYSYEAVLPTYPIRVNGQIIDNAQEEYPILNFRGITYFPMTWRFTHDTFHLNTNWDAMSGFKIGNIDNQEGWKTSTREVGTQIRGVPLNVYWGVNPNNGDTSENGNVIFDPGTTLNFHFSATNIKDQLVSVIKPVSLEVEISRVPGGGSEWDKSSQELVWTGRLPVLEGDFASKGSTKTLSMFWDQKNSNGIQVPSGKYIARLKTPISISYFSNNEDNIEVLDETSVNRGGRVFIVK